VLPTEWYDRRESELPQSYGQGMVHGC
jgi:hypothetical protein